MNPELPTDRYILSLRPEFYDDQIVGLAFLGLLKHTVASADHAHSLIDVVAGGSPEDVRRVFSGLVRLWFECIALHMQSEEDAAASVALDSAEASSNGIVPSALVERTVLDREKGRFFKKIYGVDSALFAVIKFTTECASASSTARKAILDAGTLALVLSAFVNRSYKLSSLHDAFGHTGKRRGAKSPRRDTTDVRPTLESPLASINAEASTLSVLIRTPKFQENWKASRFAHRVALCAALVDGVFGGDAGRDNQYAVTRALFGKIVGR